jgi:hypothetical protein
MQKTEAECNHDMQGHNPRYIYPDHVEMKEALSTPSKQSMVQAHEAALDSLHMHVVNLFRAVVVNICSPSCSHCQSGWELKEWLA